MAKDMTFLFLTTLTGKLRLAAFEYLGWGGTKLFCCLHAATDEWTEETESELTHSESELTDSECDGKLIDFNLEIAVKLQSLDKFYNKTKGKATCRYFISGVVSMGHFQSGGIKTNFCDNIYPRGPCHW